MVINGTNGNDTLIVDFSGGNFTVPITFNGGSQVLPPGDSLTLTGGATFGSVAHTFINASTRFVDVTVNSTVHYTGLEPITDNLFANDRTFTYTGTDETVTLADSGADGDTKSTIDSTLAEAVTFINPTGSLTVNLTNGTNTLNFNSLDSKEAGGGLQR